MAEVSAIELRLGVGVAGFAAEGEQVTVGAKHGLIRLSFDGAALIGADGLWSDVRRRLALPADATPQPARRTAWRATIPSQDAPDECRAPQVSLWLGRRAHLVYYPLRGGTAINVVAIIDDPAASGESPDFWNGTRDPALLHNGFARWHPTPRALLAATAKWQTWPLFDRPPQKHWSSGRVTLAGDAAHPMLPYLAQGAAQAIEDAAALEAAIRGEADIIAGFQAYETARSRPRGAPTNGFPSAGRDLSSVRIDSFGSRYRDASAWAATTFSAPGLDLRSSRMTLLIRHLPPPAFKSRRPLRPPS